MSEETNKVEGLLDLSWKSLYTYHKICLPMFFSFVFANFKFIFRHIRAAILISEVSVDKHILIFSQH